MSHLFGHKLYKRYDTDLENVVGTLDTYGVATVPNVLTHEECKKIREAMWSELGHVLQNRFDIHNRQTWRHFYDLMPLHSMLTQHWSLGQSQPVWDVRMHPRVGQVFSTIWNTPLPDMLVSFDGLSIHLPPEQTHKGWFRGNDWMHTDQSGLKKGRHCIQGLVNLYPVRRGDATLTVYEGSHVHHADFFKMFDCATKDDWHVLKEEQERLFFKDRGCKQYLVEASEGSMVLWDSRTMHQGIEPQRERPGPNFRMAIYVCMMPREKATPADIRKKQKAFNELRVTNHWANKPKLFPKHPRMYGRDLPEVNPIHPPVLTEVGKKLAGF